jgi:hypothetical protein
MLQEFSFPTAQPELQAWDVGSITQIKYKLSFAGVREEREGSLVLLRPHNKVAGPLALIAVSILSKSGAGFC